MLGNTFHVAVVAAFVAVLLVEGCTGINPGLKIQFSKSGINYVNDIAIDLLTKDLQGKTIPDQHGESHVAIGKIKYDVTGMKLTNFAKPTTHVNFSPGKGATWQASGGSIGLHGDWRYKAKVAFIPISDHGNFDVEVRDIRFSLTFAFGLDVTTGRPTVSASSCSADVRDVNIHIHGGASWLYNLFKGKIEDLLKKQVNSLLCKSAQKAVNENGAKALAKLKVDTRIGPDLSLDYKLIQAPQFDANHLTSFHKGEIYFTKDRQKTPFDAPTLAPIESPRMLTLWLSDYIANSAAFTAHQHKLLQYNLTSKDLKGEDAQILKTTCAIGVNCIGKMIPEIGKKFPNQVVEVALYTTESPKANIVPGRINVIFRGNMEFYLQKDGQRQFLFSANATMTTSVLAEIKDNTLRGTLNDTRVKVNVLKSDISKHTKTLERALKIVLGFVINDFVVPKLNGIGQKGLPIPALDNVHFTNTKISLVQHAIQFETDVKYDPVYGNTPSKDGIAEQAAGNERDDVLYFAPSSGRIVNVKNRM